LQGSSKLSGSLAGRHSQQAWAGLHGNLLLLQAQRAKQKQTCRMLLMALLELLPVHNLRSPQQNWMMLTQRHWRLPVTPPSIRALLGPLQTPAAAAAANRDAQYVPTQQQAVSDSTVQGAGTPQDFFDVFDLDEVTHILELVSHMQ